MRTAGVQSSLETAWRDRKLFVCGIFPEVDEQTHGVREMVTSSRARQRIRSAAQTRGASVTREMFYMNMGWARLDTGQVLKGGLALQA